MKWIQFYSLCECCCNNNYLPQLEQLRVNNHTQISTTILENVVGNNDDFFFGRIIPHESMDEIGRR